MKIKHGKNTMEIDFDEDISVLEIKRIILDKFGIPIDGQKILHAGRILKNEVKCFELPKGNNSTLNVVGNAGIGRSVVVSEEKRILDSNSSIRDEMDSKVRAIVPPTKLERVMEPRIANDLPGVVADSTTQAEDNKYVTSITDIQNKWNSQESNKRVYKFNEIITVPGFDPGSTAHARQILTDLANDRGIQHVMKQFQFKVGCLCELLPDGKVGESPVCVMGLNENKGEKIYLRLRTDDLKGFRKILSIRQVLFHELAHNHHSDHNDEFYILMRKIEKDVNEYNAKYGDGLSTSIDMIKRNHNSGPTHQTVFRLGGDCGQTGMTLSELTRQAAVNRHSNDATISTNVGTIGNCTDLSGGHHTHQK